MRWEKKGREKKDEYVGLHRTSRRRTSERLVDGRVKETAEIINFPRKYIALAWPMPNCAMRRPTCRFRKTVRQFGRGRDMIGMRNRSVKDESTDMSLKGNQRVRISGFSMDCNHKHSLKLIEVQLILGVKWKLTNSEDFFLEREWEPRLSWIPSNFNCYLWKWFYQIFTGKVHENATTPTDSLKSGWSNRSILDHV